MIIFEVKQSNIALHNLVITISSTQMLWETFILAALICNDNLVEFVDLDDTLYPKSSGLARECGKNIKGKDLHAF